MTKAPLTIRVDAKTRRYGEPSPTYTARFDGLVNGDTKEAITGLFLVGAPADASVGDYFIKPSGATNPNYDISYAGAFETVTRTPLKITAKDATKVYGAPDPAFTATYDGLVYGEPASVVTGLAFDAAPTGSDVGSYPIVPKGAYSPNYEISYANGTETITPAALTIRAQDKTAKYGTVAAYTWKGDGWVNGDTDTTHRAPPPPARPPSRVLPPRSPRTRAPTSVRSPAQAPPTPTTPSATPARSSPSTPSSGSTRPGCPPRCPRGRPSTARSSPCPPATSRSATAPPTATPSPPWSPTPTGWRT